MEIALVLVVVYSLVLTGYVLLAARLRRLVRDQRAVRVMNRTSGAVMAGAAVAVVVRA
jgi:threonine/homoserine/homoserine lactone efflux protein